MRICDYVADQIKLESDAVFGVTGGCIVNQVDAFYKSGLKVIPMHHEQAAAMAADAYARVSGKLGVCFGTSGPGGQNLLTGLSCAYYDSSSVLAIVGQVPKKHLSVNRHRGVRQYGFQETNNARIFDSAGFNSTNSGENEVAYHMIGALHNSIHGPFGRPTVSVLELCDDVQRAQCSSVPVKYVKSIPMVPDETSIGICFDLMMKAERPVLIFGAGARYATLAHSLSELLGWPIMLTWGALDMFPYEHEYNLGTFGVSGTRANNRILREADLILSIGSRLDTHCIAEDEEIRIKTIVIDCDRAENLKAVYRRSVHCDSGTAMEWIITTIKKNGAVEVQDSWWEKINLIRHDFPEPESQARDIITRLSDIAPENAIIVSDAGQTVSWTFQGWRVKQGQRLFTAFNHSPMGYALPAAIGAKIAAPDRPVICITGDGGLMMNMQELYNLVPNSLNIQIYMMNNTGYGMIRQTQKTWLSLAKNMATDYKTGLHFPQYDKLAASARIRYRQIYGMEGLMIEGGTTLHDIKVDYDEEIVPKLKFGSKIYEM